MTRIRGIDFTSRPGRMKPIVLAEGEMDGDVLRIRDLRYLASPRDFDDALGEPGPWVAGIDFPFGQPRKLVEARDWPRGSWTDLIAHVCDMGKEEFERAIKDYTQSPGGKELRRATDPSWATSPMKLGFPPAGKMFFAGAPRIAASGASIVPCAPNGSDRVIVEAYAAMVVKALFEGKVSYKGPMPDSRSARQQIVKCLSEPLCRERYDLTVQMDREHRLQLIYDPTGDPLDAILCAVQAAWASKQERYGVPDDHDALEGWIVDPLRQR